VDWINVILQGILVGGLYAMFAAGLSLIFGVMRLVNIAHGDLIVLAAYLILLIANTLHLGVILSFIIALPLMFAGAQLGITVSSILLVAVMTIYFLIGMPQVKLFLYHLIPHSRRTRAVLIGDEIFTKVGGYVLGNVITSFIAGAGTFLWMLAWGIPYPALLGLLIFLLDLIPVIGSTVGGAIVTLVALTVSIPVAIGTLVFYCAYRLAEDYLLVPRIIGHTVKVPALGGMVAIVLGGVVMGIIGALIALPVAAAIQLLLEPTGRKMTGKWVGFGRDFDLNTGPWTLQLITSTVTEATLKDYSKPADGE